MRARRLGLLLLVAPVALAGGCAMKAQITEGRLAEAGFRQLPADTPEKSGHLQTLPTRTFVKRNRDGKTYYVYADPDYCKCLYVGTVQQYARYQDLVEAADAAAAAEENYRESEQVETPG